MSQLLIARNLSGGQIWPWTPKNMLTNLSGQVNAWLLTHDIANKHRLFMDIDLFSPIS